MIYRFLIGLMLYNSNVLLMAGTDIGVKMGGSLTTIEYLDKQTKNKKTVYSTKKVEVGGMPIAATFLFDMSDSFSLFAQAELTILLKSRQMLRQGGEGGLMWHIFGGARRAESQSDFVTESSQNFFNVSVFASAGTYTYGISSNLNDTGSGDATSNERVEGGAFEFSSGLQVRQEIWDRNCVGVDLQQSVLTIPTSSEQVKPVTRSASVFWRWLL